MGGKSLRGSSYVLQGGVDVAGEFGGNLGWASMGRRFEMCRKWLLWVGCEAKQVSPKRHFSQMVVFRPLVVGKAVCIICVVG